MATESIAEFTKSIEADCMKKWARVAAKAPAMALIWQSEVRKVTPYVSGTLRRGQFVTVDALGTAGAITLSFKTSVPYWWCVNYGGPCPRGKSRIPHHFFELGTQKAIPMMIALAKGTGGIESGGSSAIGDWFDRMSYM
ncbi:MAG: hypothetical protein WC455_21155 [Dehalococcoidia bacterium]|jgi:hypothetical protein